MVNFYNKIQTKIREIEIMVGKRMDIVRRGKSRLGVFSFKLTLLDIKLFFYEFLGNFIKFLIILFKDSGFSFNLFFRQDSINTCPYSYCRFKVVQKQIRVFSMAGASAIIGISVMVTLLLNILTGPLQFASAATYTWTQTNWDTLTNNTTLHPAPADWTEYSATTTSLTAGSSISITSTSDSVVQTDNGTTNTGFNLSGIATSSTEVSGVGSSASVILASAGDISTSAVSPGDKHTCAVSAGGYVYCWGYGAYGRLGDNTTTQRNTPIRVLAGEATGADASGGYLVNIAKVVAGEDHSCAVSNAGNAYCWGYNWYGRLGDNTTTQRNTPIRVLAGSSDAADNDGTYLNNIKDIEIGEETTCAVSNAGNAYCWGYNVFGEIGDNTTTKRYTPVRVLAGEATGADASGGYLVNIAEIDMGIYSSCAVSNAGNAYCWGRNSDNQLGDNTTIQRNTPVRVLAGEATGADASGGYLVNIAEIDAEYSYTCAVSNAGNAYCWGNNYYGNLGDNTTTDRSTPVRVLAGEATGADASGGYLANILKVKPGELHSCAVSNAGNAYCWGYGAYGQLGDNTGTQRNTPIRVLAGEATGADASGGYLAGVANIEAGELHSCAVSSADNVYCWGYNHFGRLGDNTTTNRFTPIKVHGVDNVGTLDLSAVLTYSASGTYTSGSIDVGQPSVWGNLSWTNSAGQTITVKARTDADGDFSNATAWGSCTNITSGQALSTGGCVTDGHQYIQYQATLSTADTSVTPTLEDVTLGYSYYPASQSLTSSAFDSGDSTSLMGTLSWTEDTSLPSGSYVSVSLRATSSSVLLASTDWTELTSTSTNCSKSSGVVTCLSTALPASMKDGSGDRWFQYKVTVSSTGQNTPTVTDVSPSYVVNAAPELQNVTATQQSDGTVLISYDARDTDTTMGTTQSGYVTPSFSYSIDGGSVFNAITTGLSSGATTSKAVEESNWNTYTASWTAKDQIDGTYTSAFQIYVQLDDEEGANRYGTTTTASVALDVKDPTLGSPAIYARATSTPATLVMNATDDNALQMKIGLASDLTGSSWESYSSASTITVPDDPDVVYVQFKDAFGNTSAIQSATTPVSPTLRMMQDVSKVDTSEWRLFAAWGVSALDQADFGKYEVYRSGDDVTYTYLADVGSGDKTINYYINSGLTQDATYYYKIAQVDSLGNTSKLSNGIKSIVNGVQDAGEGGGGTPASLPAISSVSSATTTTQGTTITWTTDSLSNSTVGYCVSPCSDYTTEQGVSSYVTSHSVTLTELTPGTTYAYKVISADVYSNTASSTGYTVTTSDGATISGVSIIDVSNNSAQITWNTSAAATGYVVYATTSPPSGTEAGWATLDTSRTVSLTGLDSGTKYYFYVKSQDGDSNWSYDYNTVSGTNNYYEFTTSSDTDGPTITSVVASPVEDTTAVISWATNEVATSMVEYGTTSGTYTATSTLKTEYDTSHFVNLSGLTQNTKYYYRVASTDQSGNGATSTESSFTTIETQIGISEQTITTVVSGGGGGSSGISYSEHNRVKNELEKTKKEMEEIKSEIIGIEEGEDINPKDLLRIVVEKFVSLATSFGTDASLKLSDADIAPAVDSLRKLAELVPPPVLSGLPEVEVESTKASISWNTDKNTNSVIAYADEESYDFTGEKPYSTETGTFDVYTSDHAVILDNLKPATTYNYQIKAKTEVGDWIESRNYTFTTLSQMPKILNPRLNRVDDYSVSLSWRTNIPTDSVVRYTPRERGKPIEEESVTFGRPDHVTKHSITLRNLDPATTYALQISSTDPFGNMVKKAMPPFSTVKDEVAPDISQVRTELTLFPGALNKIQTIIFWKTDEPSASQVFFEQGIRDIKEGEQLRQSTDLDPMLTTSHTMVITNWQAGSVYRFRVASTDATGNISFSKDFTVLTPRKEATIVDLIIENFSRTFGWTEGLGF